MKLKRTIIKIGNSIGVTLPKSIIEGLSLKIGDTIVIEIKEEDNVEQPISRNQK